MATLKFKTADGRPDPKGLSETEVREIVRTCWELHFAIIREA